MLRLAAWFNLRQSSFVTGTVKIIALIGSGTSAPGTIRARSHY